MRTFDEWWAKRFTFRFGTKWIEPIVKKFARASFFDSYNEIERLKVENIKLKQELFELMREYIRLKEEENKLRPISKISKGLN